MKRTIRAAAKQAALRVVASSRLMISALAVSFSLSSTVVLADEPVTERHDFNHFETGFPLTGAHLTTDCGSCHIGGVLRGTPRNCAGCHTRGARVVATTMPSNHFVTNEPCENCHTSTATFLGARFNHGSAPPGSCTACHNGRISAGKPANHNNGLRVTESCEKCHRTYAWIPARFDHTGIAPGTCSTQCHNGTLATGKPASHTTVLKATSTCDTCHRFTAWFPTFYNHAAVAPGSCATCHNGSTATGRTSNHTGLAATFACDQCHNPLSWTPARYNHVGITPGSCSTCHNGSSAAGKPADHTGAKALMNCDNCHNTLAWLPAAYNHVGIAPGSCLACHAAQRPTSHTARGYTASCDTCHSIGSRWAFNHALQQGRHTCNSCHHKHHDSTPCDYCHSVNGWGG